MMSTVLTILICLTLAAGIYFIATSVGRFGREQVKTRKAPKWIRVIWIILSVLWLLFIFYLRVERGY